MMRLAINQPFDLALSLEMGQAFRWRRVGDEGIANRDWGRPPARWRTGGGGWYSGVIGQRFLAPATRRPIRRPHNPPRPFHTFRQTSRVQQPPRRRKTRHPNVPPILPQQLKQGQLMRRFPAINQLNPCCYGLVPISDRMRRTLRAQLPSPVIHLGPGTKSPQRHPRSSVADCLQFGSPATGSRPQTVQFRRSVQRQLRRRQRHLPQPLADGTLDAAHPVSGAGVTQSLRHQADSGVTVFLANR